MEKNYSEVIRSLEVEAKNDKKKYRKKVFLLGLLGYSYIFIALVAVIALIIGILYTAIKFRHGTSLFRRAIIPVILLAGAIIKSLFIKIDKPEGRELDRNKHSDFYFMIEEMQKSIEAPKIHKVLIVDEMNASICSRPRLGMLGFYENYLMIGAKLLMILNEDELKSVIAHELGHLSGKHGKSGVWSYRIFQTWSNLIRKLENDESKALVIFKKFSEWYFPIFNSHYVVLKREDELQADKIAGEEADGRALINALVKMDIINEISEELFWNKIYEKSMDEEKPVEGVLFKYIDFIKDKAYNNDFKNEIGSMLKERTFEFSTHPSVGDRAYALDIKEYDINPDFKGNSLSLVLGEEEHQYLELFSIEWSGNVHQLWYKRYSYYQECKNELQKLIDQEKEKSLSVEEMLSKGDYLEILKNEEAALIEYEKILSIDSNNLDASFSKGRVLLSIGNKEGLEIIKKVIDKDIGYSIEGYRIMHNYLVSIGENEQAKEYYDKAVEHNKTVELAKEERSVVRFSDKYIEHKVDNESLTGIIQAIKTEGVVEKAYLCRKDVQYFKESYFHVLMIEFKNEVSDKTYEKHLESILNNFENKGGSFHIIHLNGRNIKMKDNLDNIEDFRIF